MSKRPRSSNRLSKVIIKIDCFHKTSLHFPLQYTSWSLPWLLQINFKQGKVFKMYRNAGKRISKQKVVTRLYKQGKPFRKAPQSRNACENRKWQVSFLKLYILSKKFLTARNGARIPLTSLIGTPAKAEMSSRCPTISRIHFRLENCSPKLCLKWKYCNLLALIGWLCFLHKCTSNMPR